MKATTESKVLDNVKAVTCRIVSHCKIAKLCSEEFRKICLP